MEFLNLSHNLISNKGAVAIADMLGNTATLTGLYLRWNNIGAKGAASI